MTKHYVYIVSNANRTVYAGMTSELVRRVDQHKKGTFENAFTKRYNFDRLVYFEELLSRPAAAKREKQIKGWTYAKKVALIESMNPEWKDLSVDWRAIFR
jgi:putative endonuclease